MAAAVARAMREGRREDAIDGAFALAVELNRIMRPCFVAGTPIRTPGGETVIEKLREGDEVLSCAEFDPTGAVRSRRVKSVFCRHGRVLELVVGGRRIETTPEHPFWVVGQGWAQAGGLKPGDLLRGHDGRQMTLEKATLTDRWADVYNLSVAEDHTYFVGALEWGFSIWVHNGDEKENGEPACGVPAAQAASHARGGTYVLRDPATGQVMRSGRTNDLARRQLEHARDAGLGHLRFEEVHRTDVYEEQRGLEQLLHDTHKPPLNRIGGIDPKNPRRQEYLDAAREFLRRQQGGK
jgi:hypothetical protein